MQVFTADSARRLSSPENKDYRPTYEERDYDISEDAREALERIFDDLPNYAHQFPDGVALEGIFERLDSFTVHEIIIVLKDLGYKVEEESTSTTLSVRFSWL